MQVEAGIYCRISYARRRDGTVETLGVERQQPPCRELVERTGGEVVDVYVDNDTSAWSGKRRPDYERMLTDLRDGRINTLVAWQADRFIRRTKDAAELLDAVQAVGGQLLTVTGIYDLGTAAGRFGFRNIASMAEMESDLKSERIIFKHEELARNGNPKGGGIRPFGFQGDRLTHNPEEAALLQEATERLLTGETMYAVLWDFKARGVKGSTGRPINTTTLRRALLAPRTAGQRQHRGVVIGPAAWDPIITVEQQARLAALFSGHDRRQAGAPPRTLLSGIARCECGTTLSSDSNQSRSSYACRKTIGNTACGKIAVLRSPLDKYVVERVLDRLSGPGLARMIAALQGDDPDHAALSKQIEQDEEALRELERDRYSRRDASGRPLVSPETYPELRDELQARIDATRRRMRPRSETRVLMDLQKLGGGLREAWNGNEFTLEQKRAIIRACLVDLVIKPGRRGGPRRFDHRRVAPEWHDRGIS